MDSIRKLFLISLIVYIFILILLCVTVPKRYSPEIYNQPYKKEIGGDDELIMVNHIYKNYSRGKWRKLSINQRWKLSKLGKILFLDVKPPKINQTKKNYNIVIWNYEKYIKLRPHMLSSDPFENCSVKNCVLKLNNSGFWTADIVIFDLRTTKRLNLLNAVRIKNQIWTFLIDDSPLNTYKYLGKKYLRSPFNWTMTYRMDADIPIPWGRTVLLKVGEKGYIQNYTQWNKYKKQDVLIAVLSSNCVDRNHRWNYVKKLQNYLAIDVYGKCGDYTCKPDFLTNITNDCPQISQYKFFLAFENSNCNELITEKLWWYGYEKNTIPIVMGGTESSYEQVLPPFSYINTENFAKPRDLANYLIYLNNTPSDIQDYFTWKRYFKIFNEHGKFDTKPSHYCRICEALNYNSRKMKVYTSLKKLWNSTQCQTNWDSAI